ncbi:RNA polymerase II transcription factor SIII subunit A-domain-containing protein [Globomyces pollinis-pini]|nr:RNA polymerase II transcription factor SIII subunit A-domain-containing protein [Globomyces pollinis-pini]
MTVKPLTVLCTNVLNAHVLSLRRLDDLPYQYIFPVLANCPIKNLTALEKLNPFIINETDIIWKRFIHEEYPQESIDVQQNDGFRQLYQSLVIKQKQKQEKMALRLKELKSQSIKEKEFKSCVVLNKIPRLKSNGSRVAKRCDQSKLGKIKRDFKKQVAVTYHSVSSLPDRTTRLNDHGTGLKIKTPVNHFNQLSLSKTSITNVRSTTNATGLNMKNGAKNNPVQLKSKMDRIDTLTQFEKPIINTAPMETIKRKTDSLKWLSGKNNPTLCLPSQQPIKPHQSRSRIV